MVFDNLISYLNYLENSLIIMTTKGDFALDKNSDGSFVVEYGYPVQVQILKNCDELKSFIDEETILKVSLLNHEIGDENFVYVK